MPTCGMLNNNKNKKHFLSELSINNPNDNNLQYVTKAVNTGVCYCLFTSVQTLICTHTHMHTHTHTHTRESLTLENSVSESTTYWLHIHPTGNINPSVLRKIP